MKITFTTLLLILITPVQAFILAHPTYRLSNPSEVKVNISSEGCTGNGISNGDLESYITEAIEDYWNTVSESRLYMEYGSVSDTSISTTNPPGGQILVGCGALGAGIAGVANFNWTLDGCKVTMSSTVYTGSINRESFMATLIHEMGHCVGLNHSNDTASVMTYNDTTFIQPKALSRDDKDGVIYLYPNESTAGIYGSCEAIASQGTPTRSLWSLLLSFLATLTLVLGLRKIFRLILTINPK